MKIPFHRTSLSGKELQYMEEAALSGKISGNGPFTEKCQHFFEEKYKFAKALLATSCTDALEMAALLLNIREGDEIIAPSYTFVSTVNPFVMRGAKVIFADSNSENPNIDASCIEALITPRTRVIIPVHYAGIACDMDKIMALSVKHGIEIVEDAAQSIDSYHKKEALGGIGTMGAFSFHETKNIGCGEGGLLTINKPEYFSRSEIIREKGTDRVAFSRGEVEKYGWVDVGSSFLPSELLAAFLLAQLENLGPIQKKRKELWAQYQLELQSLEIEGKVKLPYLPPFATNNAHIFYLVLNEPEQRNELIKYLKSKDIQTAFHYLSLHKSDYFKGQYRGPELPNADRYSNCLLRLPLFNDMTLEEVQTVCSHVKAFFTKH
jgi:dTDP-4-amino-4,6-dideoxygalactose transaminase